MAIKGLVVVCCLAALAQAAPQVRVKVFHVDRTQDTRTAVPKAPTLDEPTIGRKISEAPQVQIKRTKTDEDQDEIFKKQAENAKYSFDTSVDDGIMDHAHYRTETRDGLNVAGMYSYSDGFFKRTVHYEADDKGYRVVKEEVEAIGDGPVPDLKNGAAVVKSSLGTNYMITADDIQKRPLDREQKFE